MEQTEHRIKHSEFRITKPALILATWYYGSLCRQEADGTQYTQVSVAYQAGFGLYRVRGGVVFTLHRTQTWQLVLSKLVRAAASIGLK